MTDRYNVDRAIKGCLVGALVESDYNLTKVSELTGLSRATCYRLLKKYSIDLKGIRGSAGHKLGRRNG